MGSQLGFYSNGNAFAIRLITGESSVYGCTNPIACNFNINATDNDGSCEYITDSAVDLTSGTWIMEDDVDCDGINEILWITEYSSDGTLIYYEPDGDPIDGWWSLCETIYMDTNTQTGEDGYYVYQGTYDQDSNTFSGEVFTWDSGEMVSSGICWILYSATGCTDSTACNFSPNAIDDDGSCIFADSCTSCDGIIDTDGDGIGDCEEVMGCADPEAINYNDIATDDDGSCIYAGCTNPEAINYCLICTLDDGSCQFISGCTDTDAVNYNPSAVEDDGSCLFAGCTDISAIN